jgi:tellurite resistance protein
MFGFLPAGSDSTLERALVEIRWAGTQLSAGPDGRIIRAGEHVMGRSLMILGRTSGSQTDAGKSISSAHCPNCGAPDSSDTSNACPYCNTVLNDGAHGWILLDMPRFTTPDAQALINQLERGAAPAAAPMNQTQYTGSDVGLVAWAVYVAAADRNVDNAERQLLAAFASQCGVSPEMLDRMIGAALSGQLEVPQPADRSQAEAWLLAMATLAQADGVITREEMALLQVLGKHVGLSDFDIKMLIKRARAEQYAAASAALRSARTQT